MKSSFLKSAGTAVALISLAAISVQAQNDENRALTSAQASQQHLKNVMNQYHNRFPVYDDVSAPGNHFHCYAKIPDSLSPVTMNGSFVTSSSASHHIGATVIRCEFIKDLTKPFGGFYLMNGILPAGQTSPLPNFGVVPNAGIDLTGATQLSFWVKGDKGGERIEFFMGGVGRNSIGVPVVPYPDSSPRHPFLIYTLDTIWRKIIIDVTDLNLNYVLGGFGWVADLVHNPNGAVFYLDDIQYSFNVIALAGRLNQPRFLRSFTMLPTQPDPNDSNPNDDIDLVLRNTAFTYDNALALLAFLAYPTSENLQYAKHIGDAFVYAGRNDRTFNDGRIRDAYAAGDIALPPGWTPNNRSGTVPVPGFYDEAKKQFFEVESNGMSTGNNAWVMIALLALYKKIPDTAYLNAAAKIGQFIELFRNNTGKYQGYQGGLDNIETSNPVRRSWASTEHNLDVYAAFSVMYQLTGASQWQNGAQHAKTFIEAMWSPQLKCYYTGTGDPNTLNTSTGQLPLDPQSWSTIASPCPNPVFQLPIDCAEHNHKSAHHNFNGFDFNEDKDGVWFEGTAQMSVAYAFTNLVKKAYDTRVELRKVQNTSPFGDSAGIAAACHDGVTSGFGFNLFRRLHIGATSWNVFAQLQFNPYYQIFACRQPDPGQPGFTIGLSNYPNPFTQNTTIVYSVPQDGRVTIKIFDVAGQEIKTLVDAQRLRGSYIVDWNGLDFKTNPVSSGSYVVHMIAGTEKISRKILLLKYP